jgi:hypothetical protein
MNHIAKNRVAETRFVQSAEHIHIFCHNVTLNMCRFPRWHRYIWMMPCAMASLTRSAVLVIPSFSLICVW